MRPHPKRERERVTAADLDRRSMLAAQIFDPGQYSPERLAASYGLPESMAARIDAPTPEERLDRARGLAAMRDDLARQAARAPRPDPAQAPDAVAPGDTADRHAARRASLADDVFNTPWAANPAQAADPRYFRI